jgi:hypothetical protein
MNLIQQAAINEAAEPTNPKEVVDALSKALVGKKITAFGPKGGGLWGDHPEVQTYRIKRIVAHLSPGDRAGDDWGNFDIYLDGYHGGGVKGKDAKGNHTILGGLIYTDKTFEKHLKELLAGVPAMKYVKSIGYSEQGMQGSKYVNFDIDFKRFPKRITEAKGHDDVLCKIVFDALDNAKDNEEGVEGEDPADIAAHMIQHCADVEDSSASQLIPHIKEWQKKNHGVKEAADSSDRNLKFKTGETVLWRGGFGADNEKKVKITGVGKKNGSTVYDLDNDHWAYAEQLSKIR